MPIMIVHRTFYREDAGGISLLIDIVVVDVKMQSEANSDLP